MALDVHPSLGESEQAAIQLALAGAGLRLDGQPAVYNNDWRRAALREAVDDEAEHEWEPQALSPRSTRGATRA